VLSGELQGIFWDRLHTARRRKQHAVEIVFDKARTTAGKKNDAETATPLEKFRAENKISA